MRRWYDDDTRRNYVRIDDPRELQPYGHFLRWQGIAQKYDVSRTTAMRCLADLARQSEEYPFSNTVLYFLIRTPGRRATTWRAAHDSVVQIWMENRRSVGNPMFVDSGYQSALARRPRGIRT